FLEVDEDGRLAGRGVAAGEIEGVERFDGALYTLGELLAGIVNRRARPIGLDDHGLDGEGGIFLAAELLVGEDTGDQRDGHDEPHEAAVLQGPFGEVELHLPSPAPSETV